MGMFTELIFGCSLKKDTPYYVTEILEFMLDESDFKSDELLSDIPNYPLFTSDTRWRIMFVCSSYYFGVDNPVNKMWYDDITNNWIISIRCNFKNYSNEIELFLDWIKPYIDKGSGTRDIYAIVTYEQDSIPTLYYLEDE
jgi:hypothetical protein